ncbi:hypothetical protein Bca4012_003619 [Brassica carinata]|uniref:CHHC U11-48K-type domain-containing protein n=1 Tax=Brassica carinata TaxID=52824 RepID=A0A8X7UWU3_BRACI|nr:hypothetical protein Bca52824_041854 [Brassica carinata]
MDRPPSFPHYQNPNPNFFPQPPLPLQNLNTFSIAPSPPPIHSISSTLSSLQSLISESQRTLASLSQNLSLLNNDSFVRCPFDPNHLMPPEALFLHSLRCPKPLDLTHLLGSFTSYRNKLELPLNNGGGDVCFFYKECPGVVSFSGSDNNKKSLKLCSDFVGSCEEEKKKKKSVFDKRLRLLPSDVYAVKSEIGRWREFPSSYSYSVLSSIVSLKTVGMSELRTWILVNSTRYGVIIDTYMRDHLFLLFRLCLKAVVEEASGFIIESDANSCKRRTYECPVLVRVLSWLASQLAVLYGEGNGKFLALDMFKHCIEVSASRIMLFRSPESSGVLEVMDNANFSNEDVAAAVAALYERSKLERKMRAIRYAQPLIRYQRVAEHGVMTAKADEERKGRPNYRPIIDHDGLPRQRSSNQDMDKRKTREELLAEERDYKRRRMSYRGKKVKRTPRQVLRDMIEGFTEEVKLAGGIGCFEKGMPLDSSSSSIGNDQKESVSTTLTDASARAYKQGKGEKRADSEYPMDTRTSTDRGKRYEEYDSSSSQRQQSRRSYKRSVRRDDDDDDEYRRTKRRSHEKESHHQNHISSRERSSSDYKTKRDDRYDRRSSRETRKQNSFEDRYNPLERD